ncbi:MAG: EAL domain-containing protein, partial [Rubrivivax sp.]|nr:EAL domain-containing protein [Rubrivivax sp.]
TLRGYEALSRWPHPTRGFVSTAEFVALAEATGLIDALGSWVLAEACAEAARWPAPLSVAVNLSPLQFRADVDIAEQVAQALAASGLDASRLEVEITESLLLKNTDAVLGQLQQLHAMGVRVAMDDFGTGYSSLAYLWRFPFDKVKIDRAFTQNLGDDAKVDLIVRSIVTLAHSLGIRVNAEGVETAAQMAALREQGCDELQGFLLGRPQPADRIAHRLPQAAFTAEVHAALTLACS